MPIKPGADTLAERLAAEADEIPRGLRHAVRRDLQVTAIVCVVGALLGLLISGRREHADEPEPGPTPDADDAPTQLIDVPTQTLDAPTQVIGRGRHRPS